MATSEQVSEILIQCCSLGDPQTLLWVVNEYPDTDFNMTTEGGVTLLMHTVIGAGIYGGAYIYISTENSKIKCI